jgi:hypothetical protein
VSAESAVWSEHENKLKPGFVALALTIVMLIMPYSFGVSLVEAIDEWWIDVVGVFWSLRYLSNTTPPLMIGIQMQLIYSFLVFGWLKVYYIYQMYKCYKGQLTKKRVVLIGVVSELQLLVWYVHAILVSLGTPFQGIFILAPIPVLLLCGQLILFMKPPPVSDHRKPRKKLWTSDSIS